MPAIVTQDLAQAEAARRRSIAGDERVVFVPEIVPRNCRLDQAYKPIKSIRAAKVTGEIIAYASPDSTFAVTKRLFDAAKKSILIGIYDFSADHIKQLVLKAMRRGVTVELLLDIDNKTEERLFKELIRFGAHCTPAPSCASKRNQVFRSSHEKVIIVDNKWCLVQSGNYSENSIPLNTVDGGDRDEFQTGNRDMGLAVESRALARFFRKVLEADIALELAGPEAAAALEAEADTFLVEAAPRDIPRHLFPSKSFTPTSPLSVLPVLSPDNYMATVPKLLRTARKSILIEQQYIRATQPHIVTLLEALVAARQSAPALDVRIILGKIFNERDREKEQANLQELESTYQLKLGKHIRYINTNRFVHCHNKLILIDGATVLVGSQNWSNAAVSENREASLALTHRGITGYFQRIFDSDWSTGVKDPTGAVPEAAIGPEALRTGRFVRVMPGDYAEV